MAHCHSIEAWGRGRTDRMPLEAWLQAVFPPLDQLAAPFIRVAVLLTAAEMLKSGVTSVIDHFRQTPARLDAVESAAAAYRESGINAAIAVMLRDRVIPKAIDLPAARPRFSVAAQLELCEEAARHCHAPADGVSIMLGPSAPHRCSDELLAVGRRAGPALRSADPHSCRRECEPAARGRTNTMAARRCVICPISVCSVRG